MNIVIITIIKELIFAPGISIRKLSTSKSPPNPLNTKENNDAPINIKKTIEFIFRVSMQADLKISIFILFFIAIITDPNAPKEADSVGVAIPKSIEPRTSIINAIGGNIVPNKCTKIIFSLFFFELENYLVLELSLLKSIFHTK